MLLCFCLDIAAPGKVVEGDAQFLLAGWRIVREGRAQITAILLLTKQEKLDQWRRVDEGHRAPVGAAILVEDATELLAANLDLRDQMIACRGLSFHCIS